MKNSLTSIGWWRCNAGTLDTDLEILKSEKAVDFRKLINLALKEQLLKCYGEEERIFVRQSDATSYDETEGTSMLCQRQTTRPDEGREDDSSRISTAPSEGIDFRHAGRIHGNI